MKLRIALFGALREADPRGFLELDAPDTCTIADLRELLQAHVQTHAPAISASLLKRCAFASDEEILHNHRVLPANGELAILPPVSGG